MNMRRKLLIGLSAATVGWVAGRHVSKTKAAAPLMAGGSEGRFPNVALTTHEGRTVRFYDELARGKLIAINMMYTQCEGICPRMTVNLRQVQRLLGERAGRDVFLYSLSLQPETDTPERLREYAERHHAAPGWTFLTGLPDDVRRLRVALGFYDPDPKLDGEKATHTGMVRIGDERRDRWTMAPALAEPEQILATIDHVDRFVIRSRAGAKRPEGFG